MMLYNNTQVMVRSPDEDNDFSNSVNGVLQGIHICLYFA